MDWAAASTSLSHRRYRHWSRVKWGRGAGCNSIPCAGCRHILRSPPASRTGMPMPPFASSPSTAVRIPSWRRGPVSASMGPRRTSLSGGTPACRPCVGTGRRPPLALSRLGWPTACGTARRPAPCPCSGAAVPRAQYRQGPEPRFSKTLLYGPHRARTHSADLSRNSGL